MFTYTVNNDTHIPALGGIRTDEPNVLGLSAA